MIENLGQPSLFFLQMVILYFISRKTINEIFYFFSMFSSKKKVVFILTSILFFPGTILHEMAHFIAAMMLMLKVKEVRVFPELEGDIIKLGGVFYEKKDVLRGLAVGVAPVLAGLFFFWVISYFEKNYGSSLPVKALLTYSIFIVSTTMFSSKQDLVDIIFLIPFIIIVSMILYVFNVPVVEIGEKFLFQLNSSIRIINRFLFYSLLIHVILILVFVNLRKIVRR